MPWYKGNIHCHSINSDGDLSPSSIATRYYEAGYQFLSITDHNILTVLSEFSEEKDFVFIKGVEFTYDLKSTYIHINGIGLNYLPEINFPPTDLIQGMNNIVNLIYKQNAFSIINHPNWRWAYNDLEISKIQKVNAFEVYNGASTCNNEGDDNNISTDIIWDRLLSQGIKIYGIASDDAHDYNSPNPTYAEPPFTGWICVHANMLSEAEIIKSLFEGNFYASNHPILEYIHLKKEHVKIKIKKIDQIKYTTSFIGKNGKLLEKVHGYIAEYTPKGNECYIRAIINDTDGHTAWTQPIFL